MHAPFSKEMGGKKSKRKENYFHFHSAFFLPLSFFLLMFTLLFGNISGGINIQMLKLDLELPMTLNIISFEMIVLNKQ